MAQPSIFQHLNAAERARAASICLFADGNRLARKPRCSQTKDHSRIRTVSHALLHPYIQPNSPVAFSRLVFDLDWHQESHPFHKLPLRYLSDMQAWEKELGVPAPNWAAISAGKNSAHIGYELETPVGRHEHARLNPQRYLAAIEGAMTLKLGADAGFAGQLCKNPLNCGWDLYVGPSEGRDLRELADYVDLTASKFQTHNRVPRGDVGRNVFLFDKVRFWAYDNVGDYRSGSYSAWENKVLANARDVNSENYDHLPFLMGRGLLLSTEYRSIGKSIAKWVWTHHGECKLSPAFSALQSWRGAQGAAASATVKRVRREQQIVEAISELSSRHKAPTMGKVAATLGISKSTLSQHYGHLFHVLSCDTSC